MPALIPVLAGCTNCKSYLIVAVSCMVHNLDTHLLAHARRCTGCKTQVCWLCGLKLPATNPYSHFTSKGCPSVGGGEAHKGGGVPAGAWAGVQVRFPCLKKSNTRFVTAARLVLSRVRRTWFLQRSAREVYSTFLFEICLCYACRHLLQQCLHGHLCGGFHSAKGQK